MTHLICFGDSITRGENDAEHGGWANRLKTWCMKKFLDTKTNEICVFNLGIGGETSEGLKKRFVQELNPRLLHSGTNIVTIAYETNDIAIIGNKNAVELNHFEDNLLFCMDYAQKINAESYLINIAPVVNPPLNQLQTPQKKRLQEDIDKYNKKILSLTQQKEIGHIDVYTSFNKKKEELLTDDGVHPNLYGHELIFNQVKTTLFK